MCFTILEISKRTSASEEGLQAERCPVAIVAGADEVEALAGLHPVLWVLQMNEWVDECWW